MRVAVVGHVEWIRFARVERLPGPGEIAHSTEEWEQAGGGGGVAAIQLALLADEAHLFTALGDDELGRRCARRARGARRPRARERRSSAAAMGVHPRRRGGGADDHDRRAEAAAQRERRPRCRGTSSQRWTRCSSSPVTSTRCAGARRAPRADGDGARDRDTPPRRRRARRAGRERRGRGGALPRRATSIRSRASS